MFPLNSQESKEFPLAKIRLLPYDEVSFKTRQVSDTNPELWKALLDVQHYLLLKSDDLSAEKVSSMSLDDQTSTANLSRSGSNGNNFIGDVDMEDIDAQASKPETSQAFSASQNHVRTRSASLGK